MRRNRNGELNYSEGTVNNVSGNLMRLMVKEGPGFPTEKARWWRIGSLSGELEVELNQVLVDQFDHHWHADPTYEPEILFWSLE